MEKLLKTPSTNLQMMANQLVARATPSDRFYMQNQEGKLYIMKYGKDRAE